MRSRPVLSEPTVFRPRPTRNSRNQGYAMVDQHFFADHALQPDGSPAAQVYTGLRTALKLHGEDPAAAKTVYGPIATWDTSQVSSEGGGRGPLL